MAKAQHIPHDDRPSFTEARPPGNKRPKWLIGAVIAIVVLVTGAAGAYYFMSRQPPHPQKVDSWQPLPPNQHFAPRFDGYYYTSEYTYTNNERSDSPDLRIAMRFYGNGTFCRQSYTIDRIPSDARDHEHADTRR
jgi:hypothetical protein